MNSQTPEQRAAYNRRYKAIPGNVEKIRARDALANAIRYGAMVRQPCEKCGAENTHGHHDDYSKPLEVRWLCHFCHAAEHPKSNLTDIRPDRPNVPAPTHCARGHDLTGDNIFRNRTQYCRQCSSNHDRKYHSIRWSPTR